MKWTTRERPKTDRTARARGETGHVPGDEGRGGRRAAGWQIVRRARGGVRPTATSSCTFEVPIEAFGLGHDLAFARLARIVHADDITADLPSEALGPCLLQSGIGGLEVESDDQREPDRAVLAYDALYAGCQHQVAANADHPDVQPSTPERKEEQ